MSELFDIDTMAGRLTVGPARDQVDVDISDIYPRFMIHGACIDTIRMPREGCDVPLSEWMSRCGGDPNVFKALLVDGRAEDITFNMEYDRVTLSIRPPQLRKRVWTTAGPVHISISREPLSSPFEGIDRDVGPPLLPSLKSAAFRDPLEYIWEMLRDGAQLHEDKLQPLERVTAELLFEWGIACKTAPAGDGIYNTFEISDAVRMWADEEDVRVDYELTINVERLKPDPTKVLIVEPSHVMLGKGVDFIVMDEGAYEDFTRTKVWLKCPECSGRGAIRDAYRMDLVECRKCAGSGKVVGYK